LEVTFVDEAHGAILSMVE
jgi:hypothetical protein